MTLENNDGVGVLHEWAYENTGAVIQVAAIPEPRAALLAGTSLLLVLRRKRNQIVDAGLPRPAAHMTLSRS